jgi:surface polysaccharide O-acyltransferase-like enzyme
MQIIVFTLNAIVIYFLADWIVRMIEIRRGEALKQRQVIFFAVFLALALVSFRLLRGLLAG